MGDILNRLSRSSSSPSKPETSALKRASSRYRDSVNASQRVRQNELRGGVEYYSRDPFWSQMLQGNEGGGVNAGVVGLATDVGATLARPVLGDEAADYIRRQGDAISEVQRRNVEQSDMGSVRRYVNEEIPAAARTIGQMGLAASGGGGFPAIASGVAATSYDQAYSEARDRGLSEEDAVEYGTKQAATEAAIMSTFQAIPGLAGLEGELLKKQVPKLLSADFVKTLGKASAAELTEEELTTWQQTLREAATLPGSEDAANWRDENGDIWNSPMMQRFRQTAKSTLFTVVAAQTARGVAAYGQRDPEADEGFRSEAEITDDEEGFQEPPEPDVEQREAVEEDEIDEEELLNLFREQIPEQRPRVEIPDPSEPGPVEQGPAQQVAVPRRRRLVPNAGAVDVGEVSGDVRTPVDELIDQEFRAREDAYEEREQTANTPEDARELGKLKGELLDRVANGDDPAEVREDVINAGSLGWLDTDEIAEINKAIDAAKSDVTSEPAASIDDRLVAAMPEIRKVFNGRVPTSEAEELVQETALRILGRQGSFDPEKGDFTKWSKQVARSVLADRARKFNRREATGMMPGQMPDEAQPAAAGIAPSQRSVGSDEIVDRLNQQADAGSVEAVQQAEAAAELGMITPDDAKYVAARLPRPGRKIRARRLEPDPPRVETGQVPSEGAAPAKQQTQPSDSLPDGPSSAVQSEPQTNTEEQKAPEPQTVRGSKDAVAEQDVPAVAPESPRVESEEGTRRQQVADRAIEALGKLQKPETKRNQKVGHVDLPGQGYKIVGKTLDGKQVTLRPLEFTEEQERELEKNRKAYDRRVSASGVVAFEDIDRASKLKTAYEDALNGDVSRAEEEVRFAEQTDAVRSSLPSQSSGDPATLLSAVRSLGGLSSKAVQRGERQGAQEEFKEFGLLSAFVSNKGMPGKLDLEQMADELESKGHWRHSDQSVNKGDALLQDLKAKGLTIQGEESQAADDYRLHVQRLLDERDEQRQTEDESGVAEAVRSGTESGVREANAESGLAEEEDVEATVAEVIGELEDEEWSDGDTSFDFGASKPGVAGEQKALFEADEQGTLFNVAKPKKGKGRKKAEPGPSQLEQIEDELKDQQSESLPGQQDLLSEGRKATKARKQRTKKKLDETVEKLRDVTRDRANAGIDPEQVRAFVEVTKAAIDHGISEFADFVAYVSDEFGADFAQKMSKYAETAWKAYGEKNPKLSKAGRVADVLAAREKSQQEVKTEQETPEEEQPTPDVETREESKETPRKKDGGSRKAVDSDDPLTSFKNEMVNENRAARGRDEFGAPPAQTEEAWIEEATARIRSNPQYVADISNRINDSATYVPTPVETAALNLNYRRLLNAHRDALNDLKTAKTDAETADAETGVRLAETELETFEVMVNKMGSNAGRSLAARKIMLARDYSEQNMLREWRAISNGEMTSAERRQVQEMSQEIRDLEKRLKAAEQQAEQQAVEAKIDEGIADDVKETKQKKRRRRTSAKKAQAQKRFDDAISELLDAAKSAPSAGGAAVVVPFLKATKAAVELGAVTLQEVLARVRSAGIDVDANRSEFEAAWEEVKADALPELDPEDLRQLTRMARQIQRSLVESGVTERDAVVDGVHEGMQEMLPEITRRQTMDALSGYGQFTPLDKNTIDDTIRDINGQLQQIAKLQDMAKGQAPKKTGQERRTPTDEERRLIQEVNEAKRKGGYSTESKESQLKTALETAKRAAQNRINDLKHEIATGKRIVRGKTELIPDADLIKLRAERDRLQAEHKKLFPPKKLTMEQRIANAERSLDRAIENLKRQLATGDLKTKPRKRLESKRLDAKRAELESLRAQRDELKALQNPKKTPEERALAAMKSRLKRQRAEYQRRIDEQDFETKPRKRLKKDDEALTLQKEMIDAKQKWSEMKENKRRESWHRGQHLAEGVKETSRLSRAIMTAVDLSAVYRQGGFAAFAHPILAWKNLKPMMEAGMSEKAELRLANELGKRKNAPLYEIGGLSLTSTQEGLTRQEEMFAGRWQKKIPGVKQAIGFSERTYVTFLNRMRADMFDAMAAAMNRNGELSDAELKAIGSFVNVATGRGDLGRFTPSAEGFALVFFAPRYFLSRIQLLAAPITRGLNPNLPKSFRLQMAKEYGRYLAGIATFYAAAMFAFAGLSDGEDEPTIEWDPRSSDFGKIKIGETRIDPLSGMAQVMVYLSRAGLSTASVVSGTNVAGGQFKNSHGRIRPLVPVEGVEKDAFDRTQGEVTGSFVRSKLSPVLGMMFDLHSGEDMVGQPVTKSSAVLNAALPLSSRDIWEIWKTQDVPKSSAMTMLSLLGMGVNTYGMRKMRQDLVSNPGDAEFAQKVMNAEVTNAEYKHEDGEMELSYVAGLRSQKELARQYVEAGGDKALAYRSSLGLTDKIWNSDVDKDLITSAVKDELEPTTPEEVIHRYAVNQAKRAILMTNRPLSKYKGDDSYDVTLAKWEAKYDAATEWIESNKDKPIVKEAIKQLRKSAAFRDLIDRERDGERNNIRRPEFRPKRGTPLKNQRESHRIALSAWREKRKNAANWLTQ